MCVFVRVCSVVYHLAFHCDVVKVLVFELDRTQMLFGTQGKSSLQRCPPGLVFMSMKMAFQNVPYLLEFA